MPFNLLTISMKKILYTFLVLTILGTGPVHAQNGSDPGLGEPVELDEIVVTADRDPVPSDGDTLQQVVSEFIVKMGDYAVVFLVALTTLVFMYGLMKYMFKGSGSDTARAEGRKLMLWGLIGIFVMISVWGLVGILASTIGHNSSALPQFPSESERAPLGRNSDGTPVTPQQYEETEKNKEIGRQRGQKIANWFQERWQNFRNNLRNLRGSQEP